MSVTRVHEDPRVTKPYSDAQWAAIGGLGQRVDADLAKHDVRLTQGGEPTFVAIDDMDGAGMELHGPVAEKARARRDAAAPTRGVLCEGRLPAHGAGQVVSGRAAAALGARRLLAHRRKAAVARSRADRRHPRAGPRGHRHRATVCRRARGRARGRSGVRDHRARGRPAVAGHRVGAAGQRRSTAGRPHAADRARTPGARTAAGPRPPGRIRAATARGRAHGRGGHRVAQQPVAIAARATLRARGRFAARPAAAARFAADRAACRRRSRAARRPVRTARRPAGCGGTGGGETESAKERRQGRAEGRDQDGAVRAGSRPSPVRLHAAADAPRGLCRLAGGGRRCGEGGADAGSDRGLHAAARPACPGAQRHAGSRRHRGEHPSRSVVGRADRDDADAVRGSAAIAPGHREVHARRAAHRDRRWQPRDARRRHARRQPVAASSRSAAKPRHVLAEPPGAVVSVLGHVHRADEPGAARRRGARRSPVRA